MSLRWRLIGGIAMVLSALWALTAVWFFFDVRAELREVLDARLASSAQMVEGLIGRGDLRLPPPAASAPAAEAISPRLSAPGGLTCQLWTLGGRLITAARDAPALAADSIPDGFSNRMVAGEPWRVYALTDLDSGLRILTAERQGLRMALVRDVAMAVSAPFVLVLPATILLVWAAVRRGLVPLERLRRSIHSRNADALDAISERGVPPEVAPLVSALNGLFTRLSSAFERERRFTDDAAHELRTPLAGVKTQLQVARAADGAIRERALAQAGMGLDRMSRLVTQILLLARLDTQPAGGVEPDDCEVDVAVASVLRELSPAAAQHDVTLARHGNPTNATAPLPASMLHTALRNLVENAINHSPARAQVVVEAVLTPSRVRLRVLDDGPGIPPAELTRVTGRFYRAATTGSPGTGLGLSIVAAIAHRYDLGLRLENRRPGTGLIASLEIPRHRRASSSTTESIRA